MLWSSRVDVPVSQLEDQIPEVIEVFPQECIEGLDPSFEDEIEDFFVQKTQGKFARVEQGDHAGARCKCAPSNISEAFVPRVQEQVVEVAQVIPPERVLVRIVERTFPLARKILWRWSSPSLRLARAAG